MFNRILVVCTGNICRSPVGEALLQQRLPTRSVTSAGLGALVDHKAEPTALELAQEEGLNLSGHRARQITPAMIQQAELILVMSQGQRSHIAQLEPTATGKTMLFAHWLEGRPEIPDPYRKSREAFAHAHQLLVKAADQWQRHLN